MLIDIHVKVRVLTVCYCAGSGDMDDRKRDKCHKVDRRMHKTLTCCRFSKGSEEVIVENKGINA